MTTEYRPADDDVYAVLNRVIDRHPRFRELRVNEVTFLILMAWSENGTPVKRHGVPCAAMIEITKAKERANGTPDVRILVDSKRYESYATKSREGLFAHELYHLEVQRDEEDNSVKLDAYDRPILKSIPDDWTINGFREVAEWYGEFSIERRNYLKVGALLGQGKLFPDSEPIEPDVTVSIGGKTVETTVEIGEAAFKKFAEAQETKPVVDESKPDGGTTTTRPDLAEEPTQALDDLLGDDALLTDQLMGAGVVNLAQLADMLDSAYSNLGLARRWEISEEDVVVIRKAFDAYTVAHPAPAKPFEIPAGSIACNKCHAIRQADVHPCPECQCSEHTISPADREIPKSKRGRKPAAKTVA